MPFHRALFFGCPRKVLSFRFPLFDQSTNDVKRSIVLKPKNNPGLAFFFFGPRFLF